MNARPSHLLSRFHERDFSDVALGSERLKWTKATAQEFFDWYMKESAVSPSRLSTMLGRDVDATWESMNVIDSWMSKSIAHEPFVVSSVPVPVTVKAKGVDIELPGNSFTITRTGWTAIFDIGILFASTLMAKCSALEWRSVLPVGKSRKVVDADTGLPALFGFSSGIVHLQPQAIMHVATLKYIKHPGSAGELSRIFNVWKEQCPG